MSKVRNFSEIAPNIVFPEFNFYELYLFNVREELNDDVRVEHQTGNPPPLDKVH